MVAVRIKSFLGDVYRFNAASKSKMISRRRGGGAGGVYANTLRTLTTKPTKIEL
jgi:molybdenum-dependent DNA-binding transcriptional regulator ModE